MSMDTVIHPAPSTRDAVEELRTDHRRIGRVLADCELLVDAEATASHADRSALVARLGALLQAHLQVRHELFEPALNGRSGAAPERSADDQALLDQLAALNAAEAHEGGFEHALRSLAANWQAHVQQEEALHLPQAARTSQTQGVDLVALGTAIAQRRAELLGDQGVD